MTTQTEIENNGTTRSSQNHQALEQFFTFMLADEEYGIDILSVLEIRRLEHTTALPSAPAFIKGVINLRGTIISVMDLRMRFGIDSIPYGASTVVVVLQVDMNAQKREIGIIVDAVSDVYKIAKEDIKEKPDFCQTKGQEYISGLVNVSQGNKDKLIILLDVNKLLSLAELQNLPSNNK